mgnify:CR=1 FL=1
MDELRALVEADVPSLVVAEVQLQGVSVASALPDLRLLAHPPRVLILSADAAPASVLSAVAAGVDGYLLKEHAFAQLGEAVRRCLAGETVLDDALIHVLFEGYRDLAGEALPAAPGRQAVLSTRAQEVLELMAAGLRNRDIGQRLGLSEHTVKVYVAQVFAFLGVSDRTSAVMDAIRRGLVRPPLRDVRAIRDRSPI